MPNGWNWSKQWDWKDFNSLYETIGDLSWEVNVCLSPNGQHLIVGDPHASTIDHYMKLGAVIVFTKSSHDQDSKWFQVGSTIFGEFGDNYGDHVAIADSGTRIAANTKNDSRGYTRIYDFDGSCWILKFEETHPNSFIGEDEYVSTSVSFSSDGKVLAVGIWQASKVYLYQFNTDGQNFYPFPSPIVIADVEGLGYSVSLSARGTSLAVGSVSPPTRKSLTVGSIHSDDFDWWMDNISERGSVFVFEIDNQSWEQVTEFVPNATRYDKIGWSVSLSENGKVLACGGYGTGGDHGDGPHKNGQVHVYRSMPVP